MAAVKQLMDNVLELVEAEVDYEAEEKDESVGEKRATETNLQPAKRLKREDSQKSREGTKSNAVYLNSTESDTESKSNSDSSSSDSSSSDSSDETDDSSDQVCLKSIPHKGIKKYCITNKYNII